MEEDDDVETEKKLKTMNHEDNMEEQKNIIKEEEIDTRTRSEKLFEERMKKRLMNAETKKMKAFVSSSHRERVEAFNKYLTDLTEHHDMPKVGNAGLG